MSSKISGFEKAKIWYFRIELSFGRGECVFYQAVIWNVCLARDVSKTKCLGFTSMRVRFIFDMLDIAMPDFWLDFFRGFH